MSEYLAHRRDGVLIVRFTEVTFLDELLIMRLGRELMTLADVSRGKLLLDLDGVTFMSSAMIGKIVALSKKCRAEGIEFRLCNVPSCVKAVLGKRHLTNVFDICETIEEALLKFSDRDEQ